MKKQADTILLIMLLAAVFSAGVGMGHYIGRTNQEALTDYHRQRGNEHFDKYMETMDALLDCSQAEKDTRCQLTACQACLRIARKEKSNER